MNFTIRSEKLLSCAMSLCLLVSTPALGRVLDPKMHHVRWGSEREWSEFPPQAESSLLVVQFDARINATEKTLKLRHRDIKQTWKLTLNSHDLGKIPQDENEMVTYWSVPAGALREGKNELRVACGSGPSDDIAIGDAELLDLPHQQALSECVLDLKVLDESGAELPARITIADPRGALVSLGTGSDQHLAVRLGVVYTSDGSAHVKLPAGDYTVYAGRGFEYSLDSVKLQLRPNQIAQKTLKIRRVVPTENYVCCDTHIHTFTYSRHGDATIQERMITLAGEGIELPIATDHNLQIDYEPVAREMNVRQYFTPVMGNEVTTSLGHFNVFPIAKGAKLINWRVHSWDAVAKNIAEVADRPAVILNHARDKHGLRPFDPSRHISLTGEDLDGWTVPTSAMEVINSGATQTDPTQLLHDWMGMLNHGYKLTPVGSSDSHDVSRYIVGQGRTYIRCSDADVGKIDVAQAVKHFKEGRVLVSYGLLTDISIDGRFGPGDLVPATGDLEVRVRVLGPEWSQATHVALYANGVKIQEADIAAPAGNPEAAGVKWEGKWILPKPLHDVHLVAIATGPGIRGPYWPTAKPYQPMSIYWQNLVLGATGAVWVDADGSGQFDSAYDYANRLVNADGTWPDAIRRLSAYDEAVAAQTASLLRVKHPQDFEQSCQSAIEKASPAAKKGLEQYLQAWKQSQVARSQHSPGKEN